VSSGFSSNGCDSLARRSKYRIFSLWFFTLPFASSSSSAHIACYRSAPKLCRIRSLAMAPKRTKRAATAEASEKGKAVSAAGGATIARTKPPGDWSRSTITEDHLGEFRQKGWLPPSEQVAARAAGLEVRPEPRAGERVCFAEFLPRGLSFPLHSFVRGLLYAYGIQLHDLTPNGLLHISCFIVLCECFLGVSPSWPLWKHLFQVRPNCRGGRPCPIGGFNIQALSGSNYFDLQAVDSAQGWRTRWFYVPIDQTVLPAFSIDAQPSKTAAWDHLVSKAESKEAAPLLKKLPDLLTTIPGLQLIATYMRMRVWPLRLRAHPMWQYEGPLDSTRMSQVELSEKELGAQVKKITTIKNSTKIDLSFKVLPYGPGNAFPEVCIFC